MPALFNYIESSGQVWTFLLVESANKQRVCHPVFVFRPSLCQMTWRERSLGTEPPLAPLLPWSHGEGSSTNPSQWQSLCHLDQQRVIPVVNEATLHPACVFSAASRVSVDKTWQQCQDILIQIASARLPLSFFKLFKSNSNIILIINELGRWLPKLQ